MIGKGVTPDGLDYGKVLKHRLVDKPWQYESLVQWGYEHGPKEWVPTISLYLASA